MEKIKEGSAVVLMLICQFAIGTPFIPILNEVKGGFLIPEFSILYGIFYFCIGVQIISIVFGKGDNEYYDFEYYDIVAILGTLVFGGTGALGGPYIFSMLSRL